MALFKPCLLSTLSHLKNNHIANKASCTKYKEGGRANSNAEA